MCPRYLRNADENVRGIITYWCRCVVPYVGGAGFPPPPDVTVAAVGPVLCMPWGARGREVLFHALLMF